MFCGDSWIDLRGGDVLVAKQGLYKDRAGAVFQQMGGKRMAQGMGRDVIESCFGRVLIDEGPGELSCERSILIEKDKAI